MPSPTTYTPRCAARHEFLPVRGLRYHLRLWGERPRNGTAPAVLVLLHGWMDVGASFQFVVDELARLDGPGRFIVAPDWRGFGRSEAPHQDCYWFPDYLGDLDALLDAVSLDRPVDLVGHSMGGNIAMGYAGVRPDRLRRLVNLEGFGLPASRPQQAPRRIALWLESLKAPQAMRDYESLEAVARRLMANNPRLPVERATWLAEHWATRRDDGRWHVLGDPAHKRPNPMLYRVDETLETWKAISAPLLWVEAQDSDPDRHWGGRYTKEEFYQRLEVVPQVRRERLADCGHMLHHDQPQAVARLLHEFLDP